MLLLGIWAVTRVSGTSTLAFSFAFGAIFLVQAPILMTHAANLRLFRTLADPTAASGSIVLSRWLLQDQLAGFLARWAVLWFVLGLTSMQAVFFGGAFACFVLGRQFAERSKKLRAQTVAPPSIDQAWGAVPERELGTSAGEPEAPTKMVDAG